MVTVHPFQKKDCSFVGVLQACPKWFRNHRSQPVTAVTKMPGADPIDQRVSDRMPVDTTGHPLAVERGLANLADRVSNPSEVAES